MPREMKNSGIEWIGKIPDDWETIRCKYISSFLNGYAFNSKDLQIDYEYPVIRIGDIKDGGVDNINCQGVNENKGLDKYIIKENDILLAMSGATVGKVGIAHDINNSYINQRVGIIRTEYPRYLFYCLSTKEFIEYILLNANGSAQPNVSGDVYGEFQIPHPSPEEQQKIAKYLDEKCSEIDDLHADIEKQIDTLEEYKKSVITEAVTKGLNPDVEMKDSGIEWIGMIPYEWECIRGKDAFIQKSDKGNSISLTLLSPTQNFGVIPQELYEELSGFSAVKLNEKTDFNALKTVHRGAFVISLRSFQGGFEYSDYEGVVSPAYQVFYPSIPVHDRYYKHLFKTQIFIDKMNSYTMSLRDGKNIAFSDFGRTYIPLPPIEEQKAIADYLDEKCAVIDETINQKKQQLETLEEYKKSLIYEYVTGKKEVPSEVC